MKKATIILALACVPSILLQAQSPAGKQQRQIQVPTFTVHLIDADFTGAGSVFSTDMDGDGDQDLLAASKGLGELAWWENLDAGSGSFYKYTVDQDFSEAYSISAADLDGDGDTDVLGGTYFGSEFSWWERTGPYSFEKHVIDPDYAWTHSIAAVDFDGDGDTDAIAASKLESEIAWFENDGAGAFTKKVIGGGFTSINAIHVTDVDLDGDFDVLGIRSSQVAWWENDSLENFIRHDIAMDVSMGISIFGTDLDGDGDVDVLCAGKYGDEVFWGENDGSQGFTKVTVDAGINWPNQVYAADLDNDLDIDILAVSDLDSYVCWYENLGSKIFEKHIVETKFTGANSVRAGDLDNDGDLDIVASAENGGKIAWWENSLLTNPHPDLPHLVTDPGSLGFLADTVMEPVAALTIENSGKATLNIQDISCPAAWITFIDTCRFLLRPDSSMTVSVHCSAGDLFNGTYRDSLYIFSNDPVSPVHSLPVELEVTGAGDVQWVDETEPDDTPAAAQVLSGPSPAGVRGTISVADIGSVTVMGDDVEDLYLITIESGFLKIKLSGASADLDLFLLKIEGISTTIMGSNHRGTVIDEVYERSDLDPGDYYVGVSIYDDHPIQPASSYSLVITGALYNPVGIPGYASRPEWSLGQNYPNPFHPETTMEFTVQKPGRVSVKVMDSAGRMIRTLEDGRFLPGTYSTSWNGLDQSGVPAAPGVFYFFMESQDHKEVRRALLLK